MKIDIDDMVSSLGVCNCGMLCIIKKLGAQYPVKTEIPELVVRWCESVFRAGSATFCCHTYRALRNAGWPVDKVKVICNMCGGTGRMTDGYRCQTCIGKGVYFKYSIPVTVRRRAITV